MMDGEYKSQNFTLSGAAEYPPAAQYDGAITQSLYLTMRDGVKIAIDVILPRDRKNGARLPAILFMARYWRSFDMCVPTPRDKAPIGPRAPIADFLVRYGYAVIVVDARGTGASTGTWPYPWSTAELADYGEVVAWIVDQPWSNGRVGAMGISYEGTTAQLLTTTGHEAIRAVTPQETELDVYADIAFPGGILNEAFIRAWNESNLALDANKPSALFPWYARFLIRGVRPVDQDRTKQGLKEAIAAHRHNPDVYAAVKSITFRDDPYGGQAVTLDDMSVFSFQEEIERSQAAIFGWGSWLDGATADTVIRRFLTFSNPQTGVVGAWAHLMDSHASPYARPKAPPMPGQEAQWGQCLRFFDAFLKAGQEEALSSKVLHYFTMGEERWKTTATWPPSGTAIQRWYLEGGHTLSPEAPTAASGADSYTVDFKASTGKLNRWHSGMAKPVVYKDRARADRRLLTYTSPAFVKDAEITGYPVVTLYVTSTASDGAFYVYLEHVDESGRVTYITEGMLRALHRKVSTDPPPYNIQVPYHSFKREDALPLIPGEVAELRFGLLPTSVLIRKGHRLRVAIAGHDKDTFARISAEGTPRITVARNRVHASCIDIPVIQRT